MHNLTDKMCPLMGKQCLLNGCTFFNERLDGCEISIMNYNLYQLKEHIRAPLAHLREIGPIVPQGNPGSPNGPIYPNPVR